MPIPPPRGEQADLVPPGPAEVRAGAIAPPTGLTELQKILIRALMKAMTGVEADTRWYARAARSAGHGARVLRGYQHVSVESGLARPLAGRRCHDSRGNPRGRKFERADAEIARTPPGRRNRGATPRRALARRLGLAAARAARGRRCAQGDCFWWPRRLHGAARRPPSAAGPDSRVGGSESPAGVIPLVSASPDLTFMSCIPCDAYVIDCNSVRSVQK